MSPSSYLLSVDVGLHTGLAFFSQEPRLLWYRSHHLPSPPKLKKLVGSLLHQTPKPTHIYLEGGGPLAEIWHREAARNSISVTQIQAEHWRRQLFYDRQHTSGRLAKQEADELARQVITRFKGKQPTSLRHDTAEAILVGLYGMLKLDWISDFC